MSNINPYTYSSKEQESLLSEIRLDKGLYVRELLSIARMTSDEYYKLCTGEMSPFYEIGLKRNQLRPVVKRLLEVLDTDFEVMFPRYSCSYETVKNITHMQYINLFHKGSITYNPIAIYELKELYNVYQKVFLEEINRHSCLDKHIAYAVDVISLSYKDTGQYIKPYNNNKSLSPERIRQRHKRFRNRVRGNVMLKKLYYTIENEFFKLINS